MITIVWDEPKRLGNLDKRGLDFADLDAHFFASAVIERARNPRLKAIGVVGATYLTVIFQPLGSEGLSIVSMRRANQKERMTYDAKEP